MSPSRYPRFPDICEGLRLSLHPKWDGWHFGEGGFTLSLPYSVRLTALFGSRYTFQPEVVGFWAFVGFHFWESWHDIAYILDP